MNSYVKSHEPSVFEKTPTITGFLGVLLIRWKLRAEQRTDRAAFQSLVSLDDDILKDIGVNRADVDWANGLPIEQNASLELQRVSSMQNRMVL